MAKKQDLPNYEIVSEGEMQQMLASSRRGRGGRTSKWERVREALGNLEEGKALKLTLHKREVQGLRQYLSKQLPGQSKVVSSAAQGAEDQYHVFVTAASGQGRKKTR